MPREFKPKWIKGDTIGRLKVKKDPVHKYRGKHKKMWFYVAECACGEVEEFSQDQLVAGKRSDCDSCRNRRTRIKTYGELITPRDLPPGVPDFSRLPPPSTIKGPDQ